MNEKSKIIQNFLETDYDFGTGIWPYVNENIGIKLNEVGEYKEYIKDQNISFSESDIQKLQDINITLSGTNVLELSKELFINIPNIKFDEKIGYYLNNYVGHVTENDFREKGSSGGFGTWLFAELMNKNYIDSVIHVKQSDKKNILFEYSISHDVESIIEGAKTKYYPVELSYILDIVKKNPGKYAIIGLPSFVSELRLLSKHDKIIQERIKFMIGLVCGHQKSTRFADMLAWQCGIHPDDLQKIDFRKKIDGNLSSDYAIEVTGNKNGKEITVIKPMKELYGGDWGKGFFKVIASDYTDDVMNETADITLGDAWLPQYTRDSKGNNIIVVRNPIIEDLIVNACNENRIYLDKVDPQTIYQSQISHYRHTQEELGFRLYKKKQKKLFYPNYNRVIINNDYSIFRKKIQNIREQMSKKGPIYFNEALEKNDFEIFRQKMSKLDLEYKIVYKSERVVNKLKRIFKLK